MSDTTASEKALDRIRKLLAQADPDSGATPEERELAAQRAAEMMARHAVTETMLDAARNAADDPMESRSITIENPYPRPKAILLNEIAKPLNVKVIRAERGTVGLIFGRRSDLDRVDFLYTLLLVQAMGLVANVHVPGPPARVRSARGNWLVGFAHRIGDRMTEGRQEAVADAGSGAELVLADRMTAADQFARASVGKTRRQSKSRVTNEHAYYAGQRAADRADLGNARVGGRHNAIGA